MIDFETFKRTVIGDSTYDPMFPTDHFEDADAGEGAFALIADVVDTFGVVTNLCRQRALADKGAGDNTSYYLYTNVADILVAYCNELCSMLEEQYPLQNDPNSPIRIEYSGVYVKESD